MKNFLHPSILSFTNLIIATILGIWIKFSNKKTMDRDETKSYVKEEIKGSLTLIEYRLNEMSFMFKEITKIIPRGGKE